MLSDTVDLGDEAHALVMPGSFVPAQRAVGQLGQLVAVPSQVGDDTVRFRLADVDDSSVSVALDDRYGDVASAGPKLRRWHGVLDPQDLAGANPPTGGPYVLEDGVTVTLSVDRRVPAGPVLAVPGTGRRRHGRDLATRPARAAAVVRAPRPPAAARVVPAGHR